MVLLLNSLLSYFLRTSIIAEDEYIRYYIIKIIIKILLIGITIFLLSKAVNSIPIFKNNAYILPITGLLFYFTITSVISQLNGISELNHLLFFLSCLCVATFEELFFRKYLFQKISNKYTGKKIMFSVIITNIFFGLAHASNFLNSGVIKITVITQIILAFGLGVLFQSLLLKFKNIILIICLHTIVNYLGTYKSKLLLISNGDDVFKLGEFLVSISFSLIIVLILMVLSYFIIRPKKIKPN